jgi:hypothetical protein
MKEAEKGKSNERTPKAGDAASGKELATTTAEPATITDVATGPIGIAAMQAQLVEWCKEKRDEVFRECEVLAAAISTAKEGGFTTRAMNAAKNKAVESLEFYDKALAALDLGYMLFPPIQGRSIEILAIRSEDGRHGFKRTLERWGRPAGEQEADILPPGEGSYMSPNVRWHKGGVEKVTSSNGNTSDQQVWYPETKLGAPEFPLVMARSQVVEATNAAMVELVFDDIAIYPARARKDPVILGRIFDPTRNRWLNFLISWRIDKRDL